MTVTIPQDKSGWPGGKVQPYPPTNGILTLPYATGSSAEQVTDAVAYLLRISVPAPTTIAQIAYLSQGNSAVNIDLGIYELNGSTYSLMSSTGSVASGADAGVLYALDLAAPVGLAPGRAYFAACACGVDGNGEAFQRVFAIAAGVLVALGDGGKKASCLPLPATIAGPLDDTAIMPWLWLS